MSKSIYEVLLLWQSTAQILQPHESQVDESTLEQKKKVTEVANVVYICLPPNFCARIQAQNIKLAFSNFQLVGCRCVYAVLKHFTRLASRRVSHSNNCWTYPQRINVPRWFDTAYSC